MSMICSSKTSVLTRATRHNIPKDGIFHITSYLPNLLLHPIPEHQKGTLGAWKQHYTFCNAAIGWRWLSNWSSLTLKKGLNHLLQRNIREHKNKIMSIWEMELKYNPISIFAIHLYLWVCRINWWNKLSI
jgi:hypothetical protein